MTYDDIVDWTEDNIPMELYESFDEWVADIEKNFHKHGHHFPETVIRDLQKEWNTQEDIEGFVTKQEADQLISGKEQREKQFFKEELAHKFKQQEQRIAKSKRQARREKKPKFTKKTSKSQRKRKRGIGR